MRRFFKRVMPDHRTFHSRKGMKIFGSRLQQPDLWHCNRRSVAGALGFGIFVAFIPVPMQTILAAAGAIWLRFNLPLAVAMVFITNPLTMPPMFYFTYKVGVWLLNAPPKPFQFELSFEWLMERTGAIWWPLLTGSLVVGVIAGIIVYFGVRFWWRIMVVRRRRRSFKMRRSRMENDD